MGSFCSNDAEIDIEHDIDTESKVNIKTKILVVRGLFNISGEISKNIYVCLVTKDENGKKLGFNGQITSITPLKTVINLTTTHDKITETLTKIKGGLNNGR